MFSMVLDSIKLFLRGQLFRDNTAVLRLWGVGLLVTLVVLVGLSLVNAWLAVVVGGLGGGALMPWLFRNLKYN